LIAVVLIAAAAQTAAAVADPAPQAELCERLKRTAEAVSNEMLATSVTGLRLAAQRHSLREHGKEPWTWTIDRGLEAQQQRLGNSADNLQAINTELISIRADLCSAY
jgi:hypothetical protein